MAPKVKVRSGLSVDSIKENLKRKSEGGANGNEIWLAEGDVVKLRFLQEPNKWQFFDEHYNKGKGFFPCVGEDEGCEGCENDIPLSVDRVFTNVYVYEVERAARGAYKAKVQKINAVKLMKLDRNLQPVVLVHASKRGTLMDADVEISRLENNKYTTEWEAPSSKPKLEKGSLIDAEEHLQAKVDAMYGAKKKRKPVDEDEYEEEDVEEEEEDDDEPAPRRAGKASVKTAPKPASRKKAEVEEDDEEEEEEEERPTRKNTKVGKTSKKVNEDEDEDSEDDDYEEFERASSRTPKKSSRNR